MNIQDKGARNQINIAPSVSGVLNIHVSGSDNAIHIGEDCKMSNLRIDINRNHCSISIEAGCTLAGEFNLRDHHTHLTVGAKTTMMGSKISMHESGNIRIGKDCMFAGDIRMDTSDMHSIVDAATGQRINPPGDITIGNHVWLGLRVYVMKGVTIAEHCVIGAHAVVTHNIPSHSVAAGVPAKVIRSGVTWNRHRLPVNAKSRTASAHSNPPALTVLEAHSESLSNFRKWLSLVKRRLTLRRQA